VRDPGTGEIAVGLNAGRLDPALRAAASGAFHADLEAIIVAAADLAFYRTCHPRVADDLQRAVAFELHDRVGKLPEVQAMKAGR
jgi:hypothetical protein